MKIRTLLLTILFITGITFQNCSKCHCCFDSVEDYFDIQDVLVDHLNNSNIALETDIISFDDYGFLRLGFIVDFIAQHQPSHFSFSLMNSAYACSPPLPGQLGSKEESIEFLKITTINDLDDNHKAGDSINDILEIRNSENGLMIILEEFLISHDANVPQQWFDFKLLSEPVLNKEFQVKVELRLSTGEFYEVTSEKITFL